MRALIILIHRAPAKRESRTCHGQSRTSYIMALNRAGRRILVAPQSTVPISLWPRILAKSSNNADVLYHFLRQNRIRVCSTRKLLLVLESASVTTRATLNRRRRLKRTCSEASRTSLSGKDLIFLYT